MSADVPIFVLDSFALLAYFEAEPAAARVKEVLVQAASGRATVVLSTVNFGEVVYITERERGLATAQTVIGALDQLPITLVDADRDLALAAAHVKAHHSVAYADAYAIALAEQNVGVVLTGDPEFKAVEHLVAVEWLPQRTPDRLAG